MATIVRAARLIDGTGQAPVDNGYVVIEGDRIAEVGSDYRVTETSTDIVIDLPDCTLLPGLVDAHSHVALDTGAGNQPAQLQVSEATQALRGVTYMRKDLLSGVTTMRTMGDKFLLDVAMKDAIARGEMVGPRLLVATRGLRSSNGRASSPVVADGPDEVRRIVRENLKFGADHIKMFATGEMSVSIQSGEYCIFTEAEVRTAVDEARRFGKTVAVHAHGGEAIDICVEAGVHSLDHAGLVTPAQIEAIKAKGTWVVLTQALYMSPLGLANVDGRDPVVMAGIELARERLRETVPRLIKAGIRLAGGSDAMHGLFAYEALYMVEFGMTPLQAITAVTRNGAELCGVLGETGTLEAGKLADVIAVAGNPAADIAKLTDVQFVMKQGERFDQLSPR